MESYIQRSLQETFKVYYNKPAPYKPLREIEGYILVRPNGIFAFEGERQFFSMQGGGAISISDAWYFANFFFDSGVIAFEDEFRQIYDFIDF